MSRYDVIVGATSSVVRRVALPSFAMGLAVPLVLGGGYWAFFSGDGTAQASSQVVPVERRTLSSSVKATGSVTFANEQELRFNQKGKVASVSFKEGDPVKKGQVIAALDASTVMADIRQAQLSVGASALQLQQLRGDKEKTMLDAQNAVNEAERQFRQAQDALDVAKQKLPGDLAAAERSVDAAQAALDQARATTLHDLASTAADVVTGSEDLLDSLYGDLVHDSGVRNAYGNDATIEIYHRLYNDYGLKNGAENAYYEARTAIAGVRSEYGTSLASLDDPRELRDALRAAREAAVAVQALADVSYRLVQGATDDTSDFTVSDINALKQRFVSDRSSAASLVTKVDTALAGFTGTGKDFTSIAIKQKEDALASARNDLLVLQTQTPGDLQKQQASVDKIQEDFRSKQLAYDRADDNAGVDEKLKQNDVAQRAASLAKTQKTLEDYRLVAPFDGVIRRLDYQVGDNLLDTGDEKYVVLENPEFLVVTVQLDQVDVVRVKRGMQATVEFDALPGMSFEGTIDEIDSTPVESSGVVSYEVSIKMPTPADLTILSGMTATVQIVTSRAEGVLAVPNLAISRTNGRATVTLDDGSVVPVETGQTDGRYTEIVSGLEEGQNVVSLNVTVSAATTQSTQNSAQQIFRLGAGGGPPGGGGGARSFQH